MPSDEQIAELALALDGFARRFKLMDAGSGRPLAELDKQILLYVDKNPDCGPTDVARFLDVATTTISSETDRLEKRGLLTRHRPDEDRRAVALSLSPEGQASVAAQKEAYTAMFRTMLERLSPAERKSLIAMMTKIASYET